MPPGLLDKRSILELVRAAPPLIEGAVDLEAQVQPNGFDLTLRDVAAYASAGAIDFSNALRVLSDTELMRFDSGGRLFMEPGSYLVTFNEVVNLPRDLAALGRTRSSLLRCGVALHTAVWDAGYRGRSQSLLTVYNPHGFTLHRDARIVQLVFLRLAQPVDAGYAGRFLGENV